MALVPRCEVSCEGDIKRALVIKYAECCERGSIRSDPKEATFNLRPDSGCTSQWEKNLQKLAAQEEADEPEG